MLSFYFPEYYYYYFCMFESHKTKSFSITFFIIMHSDMFYLHLVMTCIMECRLLTLLPKLWLPGSQPNTAGQNEPCELIKYFI